MSGSSEPEDGRTCGVDRSIAVLRARRICPGGIGTPVYPDQSVGNFRRRSKTEPCRKTSIPRALVAARRVGSRLPGSRGVAGDDRGIRDSFPEVVVALKRPGYRADEEEDERKCFAHREGREERPRVCEEPASHTDNEGRSEEKIAEKKDLK